MWTSAKWTATAEAPPWVKSSGNNYLYPGVTVPIVDSENNETGYDILVNTRFMSNGTAAAGGLTAPKAEYLGDLAVETATYDYLFVEGFQNFNFFTFRGLDPKKAYRFHTFGCRANDQTRVTKYEFRGLNNWSESHQTSGTGTGADGYNGNNNHISVSDPIYPDENGCITFTMSRVSNMLHVNAMKIEELSDAEPLPTTYELTQTMYIDFGEAPANRNHGKLTEGADANGHYWNIQHLGRPGAHRPDLRPCQLGQRAFGDHRQDPHQAVDQRHNRSRRL